MSPAPRSEPAFAAGARRRSPLALTPLIDIVFILLIFFMLATSFDVDRRLPLGGAGAAGAPPTVSQLLVLADGVAFEGRRMTLAEAMVEAGRAGPRAADRLIVVEAGRGVPLQPVVEALAALRAAGVGPIAVARP